MRVMPVHHRQWSQSPETGRGGKLGPPTKTLYISRGRNLDRMIDPGHLREK